MHVGVFLDQSATLWPKSGVEKTMIFSKSKVGFLFFFGFIGLIGFLFFCF